MAILFRGLRCSHSLRIIFRCFRLDNFLFLFRGFLIGQLFYYSYSWAFLFGNLFLLIERFLLSTLFFLFQSFYWALFLLLFSTFWIGLFFLSIQSFDIWQFFLLIQRFEIGFKLKWVCGCEEAFFGFEYLRAGRGGILGK